MILVRNAPGPGGAAVHLCVCGKRKTREQQRTRPDDVRMAHPRMVRAWAMQPFWGRARAQGRITTSDQERRPTPRFNSHNATDASTITNASITA